MSKIILSTLVAITAVVAVAAPSQAGYRWHQNKYYGDDVRIVVQQDYQDYGVDEDEYCHVKKVKKYNKWGERVVKFVTVCN